MKLKTKLILSSVLLIVTAIIVCSVLIVSFAWDRAFSDAAQTAVSDVEFFRNAFSTSFFEGMINEETVQRSYVIHRFRSIPGANEFTLYHDSEYLSNNVGFSPEKLLEINYSTFENQNIKYRNLKIDGVSYLICGITANIDSEEYSICLVRDISELTASITALAIKCIVTSAIIIVIAALFMWMIVFRSLKPVEKLRAGASELAQGNYENRIEINGKDELAELADDFNMMADAIQANIAELNDKSEQLQEKSVRQQAFINDLSHEMKTPVTSILLNAEMLLGRKVTQDVLTQALDGIYDQGKWLERLSQKLMTLVMLQNEIELQEENVSDLIEGVRISTEAALKEKKMELITKCDIDTLPMDIDLMRSALVNLVENAKRASEDGQIISLTAHDNILEVVDHGKGIPKEEIARITEPFYMVDRSRSKLYGGSGLGMALVRRIVDAHGAELVIESEEAVGTTMRIIFPRCK